MTDGSECSVWCAGRASGVLAELGGVCDSTTYGGDGLERLNSYLFAERGIVSEVTPRRHLQEGHRRQGVGCLLELLNRVKKQSSLEKPELELVFPKICE